MIELGGQIEEQGGGGAETVDAHSVVELQGLHSIENGHVNRKE